MQFVFDIGGTNMRMALSLDGKTVGEVKVVPTIQDFEAGVQILKQIADELSNGEKIQKIAGGITGALDKEKTGLVKSAHLADWANKPLKQVLERIFGVEVRLENDTALGGLGEAVFGAGKGAKIVAYLVVGTGVGGVRIVNGKVDESALGFEPGHQIIVPDGNDCNCGGKGHLEAYVGGWYLEKIYRQKAEDIKDPAIWDEVSKYLAIGLTNAIVHWSPDILILGGSVSRSIALEKVNIYLGQFLTVFPQIPLLANSALGGRAGLLGALKLLT